MMFQINLMLPMKMLFAAPWRHFPMTDYKALCKELTNELHGYASANPYHDSDELVARARLALAAEAEGEELRSDGGYELGSMWTGHPLRPAALAEPEPPAEGENV
jgi:hypothetical protein